jgi:hypothetical protein
MWLERLEQATTAKPRPSPSVTVVVPFTPGICAVRDRVWEWVRARYAALHPSWSVVVAEGAGEWSKGRTLADTIAGVTSDVVIVADADCVIPPADLSSAVARVAAGAPWVVPHRQVLRLDERETERVLASPREEGIIRPQRRQRRRYYEGIAGGGIVVIRRDAWDIAPMDPRFVGWGYEDICWGIALDTLVGDHVRLDGDLIHLWHPPQENHASPNATSEALYQSYLAAKNLPRRVRALVAGEDIEVERLPAAVRFRAPVRIMRIGGLRLRFENGEIEVSDADIVDALRRRDDVEEVA